MLKAMKTFWSNEEGLTLVELLLVLVVSAMIIGLANMALISSINVYDRVLSDIRLRNEAAVILAKLEQSLKNADRIELEEGADVNRFLKFTAVDVQKTTESATEIETPVRIEIKEDNENGFDLWIDGVQVNNSMYSLKGSYFKMNNNRLEAYITVSRESISTKPITVYSVYNLE